MKIPTFRNVSLALAAIGMATAMTATPVLAEYPERPITLMIGYKAGGGTDTVGRVLAKVMGRELGQQVNILNKAGAG
ncbi:MAG: tripartite tricarboxylate transporter substrate binding protein, partial [Rhodospirillaceae bacterium]|nr:tripartite tricarboxylate transporter substrate binding protein [Rhodospirillaceae bacterium]